METQTIKIRNSSLLFAHSNLLEWNPGNGKWYQLNSSKLLFCNGDPEKATHSFTAYQHGCDEAFKLNEKMLNVLNAIYRGLTVTVKGCYKIPQKTLIVKLEEKN